MLRLFVLLFIIQNIIHLQIIRKYTIENIDHRFSVAMGFQNANENEFHGSGNMVIWPWKVLEKFWK